MSEHGRGIANLYKEVTVFFSFIGCVASIMRACRFYTIYIYLSYDIFSTEHIAEREVAYVCSTVCSSRFKGDHCSLLCRSTLNSMVGMVWYTCLYTLFWILPEMPRTLHVPICRNHPGLRQPEAALVAAAVVDKADTPGNHPAAAAALAAAEAAERYAQASVAGVANRRSSGSPATSAALGCSGLASAADVAAVAVAAEHTGRTRQQRRAYLWSGGCRRATRSRLCQVLAGYPS